jgi:serine/threonine protein kinase
VYQAEHRPSKEPVALKVYAKGQLSDITRRQVQREIQIQGRCAHDHIAKLVCVPVLLPLAWLP